MKNSKLHISLILTLFLVAGTILFSSVTSYYPENITKENKVEKADLDSEKNKEAKVDVSNGLLAIVVSIVNIDFCKVAVLQNKNSYLLS